MIVAFPHMGDMNIVLNALFTGLGCEVKLPPSITKKTLELGVRHSPEAVCLPFKMTLGNMIEALEQGADTIVTCGGVGPCRLGYYAEVQKSILQGLGYKFELLAIEPNIGDILRAVRRVSSGQSLQTIYSAFRLAIEKMNALDDIQRNVLKLRPREKIPGQSDAVWQQALSEFDAAKGLAAVRAVWQNAQKELDTIELSSGQPLLRVGIVGEIYVMLEPYVNLDLYRRLGRMGVEVHQTMQLSDYVNGHLFRKSEYLKKFKQLAGLAEPYLGHYVGGHGLKSIAHTVNMGTENFDGIIHVFPFSCMPEVIAINILPKVSNDVKIPVLSLAYDEQSGDAGVTTRLEAFIDLLKYRRLQRADIAPGALEQ